MKKPTYKVRVIGGTLAVTLPRDILKLVPLIAGDEVSFRVVGTGNSYAIVIDPEKKRKKR